MALGNLRWLQNDLVQAEQAFKTAAELAPVRSAKRLRYATFKTKTGDVAAGKRILGEMIQQAPDYLPASLGLAEIALAEKKYDDCASLLKKILTRDQTHFEALLLSGRLKLVKGELAEAMTNFERMAALYPRAPQVHYHLALAQLGTNEVRKAMGSLAQAVALDPNFAEATLLLAELNIRKGDAAAAIAPLSQLVKQQPQIAQAHLLLANAYLIQKNPDAAVAVYRRMTDLFAKNPQVPLLMGIVLEQQQKLVEARKAFEKALELSPDFLPAMEKLVDVDLSEKKYSTALERIKKEMEKKPGAAELHVLLAKIHVAQAIERLNIEREKTRSAAEPHLLLALNSAEARPLLARLPLAQQDLNQAEAALLKAIELNANFGMAYQLLAQIYVASNKHQQALDRLTDLVAKKTNDVGALMQIGMIHNELTNFAAARGAYEKLLAINPRFISALNNLAYLYSEKFGLLDQAYELAERARQLLPYEAHIADTLGWILYKKGKYPRALGLLQESAGKLPAEPEVQLHLGMTHYMLGEEEPARIALQQAVQSNQDFPGKEDGRRRLAMLAIEVKTADAGVLADLEKRLREEPNDPVALSRLAAVYERDGAIDKAVKTYETALKQNPQNARLMITLAQLYSGRLNDPRKALELAKEAHNLAPDDARISQTLGRLVYQAGDHQRALSLLQEAARKLPADPELQYDLAWSYYSVGRVAEAESAMQSALQAGTSPARGEDAKRFLAMIAAGKDAAQNQTAAPQVQKILTEDPGYVPALMASALLAEKRGNYNEAQQLYDKVLARYPLFAPATRQLAGLYAEHLGDDQKAYPLALKARVAFPDDPEVARTLGILAYRRTDYTRSAQLLQESAQKRNDDAELLYYLGMAHYKLKEQKASKDALQRALALNVPGNFADEAKRVIAEMNVK